jgi:hypothetical protein
MELSVGKNLPFVEYICLLRNLRVLLQKFFNLCIFL